MSIRYKAAEKQSIAEANKARRDLEKMLYLLAACVERIADSDETIVISSGFEPVKQRTAKERPNYNVTDGTEHGQVMIQCKTVKGAGAYLHQFAVGTLPESDELWQFGGVSLQSRYVIENLKSEAHIWFRSAAVTSKGLTAWSEPIMKIIA
jgi:hypothetical protein